MLNVLFELSRTVLVVPLAQMVAYMAFCPAGDCYRGTYLALLVLVSGSSLFVLGLALFLALVSEQVLLRKDNLSARNGFAFEGVLSTLLAVALELMLQVQNHLACKVVYGVATPLIAVSVFWNCEFAHHLLRQVDRTCWLLLAFANSLPLGDLMGLPLGLSLGCLAVLFLCALVLSIIEIDTDLRE